MTGMSGTTAAPCGRRSSTSADDKAPAALHAALLTSGSASLDSFVMAATTCCSRPSSCSLQQQAEREQYAQASGLIVRSR